MDDHGSESEHRRRAQNLFTDSAAIYDAVHSSFDFAAAADQVDALIACHKQTLGTKLLDVACGTGAYLEHLRNRYAVEGVDLSPAMLAIARRKLSDVQLHEADMVNFDLGWRFDVVVCLGSSIGYAKTVPCLRHTLATLARHALPGAVVIVEPWFPPETWEDGRLTADLINESELKVARVLVSGRVGQVSTLDIHHLVARPRGVEYFVEHHELGLFTQDEYLMAFHEAGLDVTHHAEGLLGRGVYVGVRP